MAEEKAFELGKKLGETSREVTTAEREKARGLLEWSKAQGTGDEGDHKTQVEKG